MVFAQKIGSARVFLAAVVILMPVLIGTNPTAVADEPGLVIEKVDVKASQVEGARGAALAVLKDGSLLLGGGLRGDTLFHYSQNKLVEVGTVLKQSERVRDSRFAPTDIAVLSESADSAELLISYPRLRGNPECVRLVLYRYVLDKAAMTVAKKERWFLGRPCVAIRAVQHAAGRIEIIDSKRAYLTTGDLGYPKINQVSARGLLGGVFEVSAKKVKQISNGHRNAQGIVLINKDLYISEHGPRGGDELNLIKVGRNYGWPFVTYGQAYGPGDYVRPSKPGTHDGYEEPLKYWVPSVAPTELIQLPEGALWGERVGNIVMGTLAAEVLIFIELTAPDKVGKVSSIDVGERIRDLDLLPDGRMVATTDGGKVLVIGGISIAR